MSAAQALVTLSGPGAPSWPVPGSVLRLWAGRRAHRAELRRLLRLGAYLIEDIGLPLEAAAREAAKPFWRA